jgi:D-alanyl-D-alanine carboxypeptidase
MLRARAAGQPFRWSALALAVTVSAAAISSAEARGRRAAAAEDYQPSYASIVVDANTGAVMQQSNADSPRHPASLTKIMTLYLLFEKLEAGKIKLTSDLVMSPYASSQAPSKLGIKPGESIKVETAIRAIVTKSANDVAVMVAEALAGSEEEFAKQMTAKARALGMSKTLYRNASGLPDPDQITTARDQALLGRMIQERFPKEYAYFATRTFEFRGKAMRNHNHLLGVIPGVDGIKTGYIHDSGFNIVTSMRRNGRHIIAVVFGGRTAEARDARVASLMNNNINVASAKRTAPTLAENAPDHAKEKPAAQTAKEAVATAQNAPQPGSTEPIRPNPVKTVNVKASAQLAALASTAPIPAQKLSPTGATATPANVTTVNTVKAEPNQELGSKPQILGTLKVASNSASVPVVQTTSAIAATAEPAAKARGGWMIQVGAFDDEAEAKKRLSNAQDKAKDQLGRADGFTERVAKGDKSLFRARFAGLDKDQAEAACKHLKGSEIPCMLIKN